MLKVRTEAATGGGTLMIVTGVVDMASADALAGRLREAVARPGESALTVDLAGVSFLDSNGIRVLIEAYRMAEHRNVVLRIRDPRPVVDRVLRVTGVAGLLGLPAAPP